MKKKSFLSSLVTIILCLSLIAGSTYALFTSEDQVNIAITSGKVNVVATILEDAMKTYSLGQEQDAGKFANGGTAVFTTESGEKVLTLDKMTPGDRVEFAIQITNNSNVAMKYCVTWAVEGELSAALTATAGGAAIENGTTEWTPWPVPATEVDKVKTIPVVVELPSETGNTFQDKNAKIVFTVEAVQGNAPETDEWDGSVDTAWYEDADATVTEFVLNTAEQFAGFAALVAEDANNFEGKTIVLNNNIDLGATAQDGSPISFEPIGSTGERDARGRLVVEPFKGTFDGNGKTISNLYQSGWDFGYEWGQYGSVGLFSELESATVKNVVIDGFDCQIEGGDVAFIAGSATGDCTFENITIQNGTIGTYNNGIGGIIGWSGAGTYVFKDITIGEDVVLGGLWGSFDSSIGGVVGQGEPGATYVFENVDVACRLDAYNDVTASYQYYLYRMTGMLIGRLEETTTIDGKNYPDMSKYNITCTDVTVTYGDWMNYHYCYGFNGSRYTRVESGYAYGGLDITAENHASTCTDHMLCLPFDGLFGGDQYGVRPITEYPGVTVYYPASYTPDP